MVWEFGFKNGGKPPIPKSPNIAPLKGGAYIWGSIWGGWLVFEIGIGDDKGETPPALERGVWGGGKNNLWLRIDGAVTAGYKGASRRDGAFEMTQRIELAVAAYAELSGMSTNDILTAMHQDQDCQIAKNVILLMFAAG